MKHLAALAPLALPLFALLTACSGASHPGRAQSESALTAPGLGGAATFAVLGGVTVTNGGPSTIGGDVGVFPGAAVTGFPPGLQTSGAMHKADAIAKKAQGDLTAAYDGLAAEPCTMDLSGTDLGGLTLKEGVYCFTSSAQLTGALTLDGEGKADPVFVFKMVSKLTAASHASVVMINGASSCGVYWQVGSSATIGTSSAFAGTIVALTSIALQTGASVDGRALARNGEVTMDDNHVAFSSCIAGDAGPGPAVDSGPADTGAPDGGVDTAPPCDESESACP